MDLAGLRAHCQQRVEQGEAHLLIAPLLDVIEQLSERLFATEQRVARLQQAQYGSKRERVSKEQLQLALGQLPATETGTALAAELEEEEEERKKPRLKKPRTPRQIPQSIPRRVILSQPSEADKWCSACNLEKQCIGSESAEVLEYEPGGFFVQRTERQKFACGRCKKGVVIGPGPDRVLEQAMPGPGLLAEVVVRKFSDHTPLERQSRIFCQRYGITLSASTLGDWIGGTAEVLKPLYLELLRRILGCRHISVDDTPVRVLDQAHDKGIKRGHIWSLLTDEGVVYFYTPTWSGEPVRQLLQKFDGVLQSDGYRGLDALYKKKKGAPKRAGCIAHARRYFVKALELGDIRAAVPLSLVRKLYKIEDRATEAKMDADARLSLRQAESAPVMEQLKKELDLLSAQAPPKSPLGKAIGYALRQWETLQTFLSDGKVRIDNNHVERTLRSIAMGRRNWLFAGSDEGAQWMAILKTLLGTCHLVGIRDPWEYLRDILSKLARGWPNSRLGELLPQAWLAARTAQAQQA